MYRLFYCKFFISTLVVLLAAASGVAGQDNGPRTNGLNGRIKVLTEYNFSEGGDNGVEDESGNRKIVTEFDENGNKTVDYRYGEKMVLNSRSEYKFDSRGRFIEEKNYDGGTGKLQFTNKCAYDSKGNELVRRNYKADRSLFLRTNMKYDDWNNLIEEKTSSPGGRTLSRAEWRYDTLNNPVEEVTYDADGLVTRKTIYRYDSRRNIIEDRSTYYDITLRTTYVWDSAGNMAEESSYNAKGQLEKKTKYRYNDKGHEVEQQVLAGDGSILRTISFNNFYDLKGNLLKKVQVENGKESILVQREIVYY